MTLSDIIKRVRFIIGEPNEDRFTDDDSSLSPMGIISLINDAALDFASLSHCLLSSSTTSLVAAQSEYSLPSDCLAPYRITVDGEEIRQKTQRELDELLSEWQSESGTPLYYFYSGETTIRLVPTPDTDMAGKDLEIFYYEKPDEMSQDTDVCDIPDEYCPYLASYVGAIILENDGEVNKANLHWQRYYSGVKIAKQATERRIKREYPTRFKMKTEVWPPRNEQIVS